MAMNANNVIMAIIKSQEFVNYAQFHAKTVLGHNIALHAHKDTIFMVFNV